MIVWGEARASYLRLRPFTIGQQLARQTTAPHCAFNVYFHHHKNYLLLGGPSAIVVSSSLLTKSNTNPSPKQVPRIGNMRSDIGFYVSRATIKTHSLVFGRTC